MSIMEFSQQILDLGHPPNHDFGTTQGRTLDLKGQSNASSGRWATIRRALASGVSTYCGRFLAALHESRRKRAAMEIARFRDLNDDIRRL